LTAREEDWASDWADWADENGYFSFALGTAREEDGTSDWADWADENGYFSFALGTAREEDWASDWADWADENGYFSFALGTAREEDWASDWADWADENGYFHLLNLHTMLKHKELTEEILGAFYEVYNELGHGFLERVYQNAMYFELKERGFEVTTQQRYQVFYKGRGVGEYFSDLVVNNLVILELKACETILEEHEIQLRNYLRSTAIEVGFVLNFGVEPEFSRKYFSNKKKKLKRPNT
jgi:GxxExxY protein